MLTPSTPNTYRTGLPSISTQQKSCNSDVVPSLAHSISTPNNESLTYCTQSYLLPELAVCCRKIFISCLHPPLEYLMRFACTPNPRNPEGRNQGDFGERFQVQVRYNPRGGAEGERRSARHCGGVVRSALHCLQLLELAARRGGV